MGDSIGYGDNTLLQQQHQSLLSSIGITESSSNFINSNNMIFNNNSYITNNNTMDRPWLPPEYLDDTSSYYRKLTSAVDVWAFGTTLWQIFNQGQTPNFYPSQSMARSASLIKKNGIAAITNFSDSDFLTSTGRDFFDVYNLIKLCWKSDCNLRIQPYSILGNMSRILSSTYQSHTNLYHEIGNDLETSSGGTASTLLIKQNLLPSTTTITGTNNSEGSSNGINNHQQTNSLYIRIRSLLSKKYSSSSSLKSASTLTDTTSVDLESCEDNENDELMSIYSEKNFKDLYEIEKISGEKLSDFEKIGEVCFFSEVHVFVFFENFLIVFVIAKGSIWLCVESHIIEETI